jgi:hypothetical protein
MCSKINYTGINNYISPYVTIIFFLSGLLLVLSCGGVTIREDQRIQLQAGQSYQGTQNSVDYRLEYQYVFKQANPGGPGSIEISGKVNPKRRLDSLDIYLNFLDAEGKRLGSKNVFGVGAGMGAGKGSFSKTFETPPGTVSIAFTYTSREKIDRL